MKKILALSLALALVFALGACAAMDKLGEPLTAQVEKMLACQLAGDEAGAYALLYPGVIDEESYHGLFAQICDYFPLTEPYELSLQRINKNANITAKQTVLEGQYLVEFDGQAFYLLVSYVSGPDGEGFQTFRIINKAEYEGSGLQPGVRT